MASTGNPVIDRATVERIVRQVALEYLGRDSKGKAPELVVQASSRHMHVCREDMDVLFGPGSELTFDRPLFQEGNFAAKEMVTIVGPRSRIISNLRIGPRMRKQSQVELAFTDRGGVIGGLSARLADALYAALSQHGLSRNRRTRRVDFRKFKQPVLERGAADIWNQDLHF